MELNKKEILGSYTLLSQLHFSMFRVPVPRLRIYARSIEATAEPFCLA